MLLPALPFEMLVRADDTGQRVTVLRASLPELIIEALLSADPGDRISIALRARDGSWHVRGARVLAGQRNPGESAILLLPVEC